MNDAALSDFDAIAILEPHLHLNNSDGQPGFGHYSHWQATTPSVYRTDGHIRHSLRAMLWINTKVKTAPVVVDSYDVAATIKLHDSGPIPLIAAYDPNDHTARETPPADALRQKLSLLRTTSQPRGSVTDKG